MNMLASAMFAASTQRSIGAVIAALIVGGFLIYLFFNWLEGREEIGAEIELAANRKPAMSDEEMETKRLDLSLSAGLVTLAIIAIGLPLYWLGEPGRHQGAIDFREGQFVKGGAAEYEELCAQCHGTVKGEGGLVDWTLLDDTGVYVDQVQWKAPSLGGVMYRFSEEEVRYVLDYGRQNSPMPAWGTVGGGPLTDQQVQNLIVYLASEQFTPEEMQEQIERGVGEAALRKVWAENETDRARQLEIEEELAEISELKSFSADGGTLDGDQQTMVDSEDSLRSEHDEITASFASQAAAIEVAAEDDQVLHGELLFNNPAGSGAYGCARCHSAGWSYDASDYHTNELVPPVIDGGGGFGPNLNGGAAVRQFDSADAQTAFISVGSVDGERYGNFGQGEGGGQMPAFGECVGDRDTADRGQLVGLCEQLGDGNPQGILTIEQIEAIVAYERGL